MTQDDLTRFEELLNESIRNQSFVRCVLSRPRRHAETACRRIDVRPVQVGGRQCMQFSRQIDNQQLHENLPFDDAVAQMLHLIRSEFRDATLLKSGEELNLRTSKKGRSRLLRRRRDDLGDRPVFESHNRVRPYLIPENRPVPFLIQTGLMTESGRVRARCYDKFRQINRYVEFARDVLRYFPGDRPVRIVDFGSGKSYLTFALHYYLTEVEGREVDITGIDRRKDVVAHCEQTVKKLDLNGIRFVSSDIREFQPNGAVDLTVSLHACDVATDYALASAVRWNSKVIFAVPCCHHELAEKLTKIAPEPGHKEMLRHGILRERFAELATDTIRAGLLEAVGYTSRVMEFIDLEHTARNVLIRAIRHNAPSTTPDSQRLRQLDQFCRQHGLPQLTLYRELIEPKVGGSSGHSTDLSK